MIGGWRSVRQRNFAAGRSTWLCGSVGILRRILFRLFDAIIATNGDFFATDVDLDAAVVDVPVANRAFVRIHELSFQFECKFRRAPQGNAVVFAERIVTRRVQSDFQILAHFVQHPLAGGVA